MLLYRSHFHLSLLNSASLAKVHCPYLASVPGRMALIAIRTVVHIAGHTLVFLVRLVLAVAVGAREDGVVRRVRVATVATTRIPVIHGEPLVVERCA